EHRELAVGGERVGDLAELLADHVELVLLASDGEQRARVYLGELLHYDWEIPEKSSSLSASSTSRRWSASSSVLRVTFSVAMIVRSATSRRRSSSARLVATSISRCARLVASATVSRPRSLASFSWTSADWRARCTISSACSRACFVRSRY